MLDRGRKTVSSTIEDAILVVALPVPCMLDAKLLVVIELMGGIRCESDLKLSLAIEPTTQRGWLEKSYLALRCLHGGRIREALQAAFKAPLSTPLPDCPFISFIWCITPDERLCSDLHVPEASIVNMASHYLVSHLFFVTPQASTTLDYFLWSNKSNINHL